MYIYIMDNNLQNTTKINYLKADDNRIINVNCIRWVKKFNECLEVCLKQTGCNVDYSDTIRICKYKSLESYNKLNKHFE
jgi:hypothetical protein